MAKPFSELKQRMPKESQERVKARTQSMLIEMALQDLRKSLNITQEELAQALSLEQPGTSKLEYQEGMFVSTLSRYVSALGGKLKLVASFPDKDVVINQFE